MKLGPAIETDIAMPLRVGKSRVVTGAVETSIALSFSTAGSVEELADDIARLPPAVREAIEVACEAMLRCIAEHALPVDNPAASVAVAILMALVLRAALRLRADRAIKP
jgi:hypothetical protein